MIFSCSNIKKSFGSTEILKNITFKMEEKEKIAIVGVNGSGKSTFLKLLTGQYLQDSGDFFIKKNISIGYLSQHLELNLKQTIIEEVTSVFNHIIAMETSLRQLENKMGDVKEQDLNKIMHQYELLSNKFRELDGYSYQSKIKGVLKGLGFKENEFNQIIDQLSGGQKTRLNLAKLLLKQPDFLLLDEPTNHLDIEAIAWLENYIKNYPNAVIIVSHDRYFINQIASKIIEIENGKSTVYQGKYHNYADKKKINRDIELKHYLNQQKIIKKQEESIALLYSYSQEKKIKRAKSKQKQLDKIELIEKPSSLPEAIKFNFNSKRQSGFEVLTVNNLAMAFEKPLFKNVSFTVKKHDRIAVLGANGIGKTTLFKILLGHLKPLEGNFKYGSQLDLGYYDQEHSTLSTNNKNIFDEIHDKYPLMSHLEIRNVLATFQFKGDDVFKEINVLSGGEKGRVALVDLLLKKANLLILDEPTNHLDIQSKEILEDALATFDGTIIFISHDRYFINKIANKIIDFNTDGCKTINGNYDDYLILKKEKETNKNVVTKGQLDYISNKQAQAQKRKKENQIIKLEQQISDYELEIEKLEQQLLQENIIEDYIQYNQIQTMINQEEEKLNILINQWETLLLEE